MKILILNPPHPTPVIREGRCQSPQDMRKNSIPQMTLAYIAGQLEREGHELSVYDCIAQEVSQEDLFADMQKVQPDLAIINTTTPTIANDLIFIGELKKKFPECHTCAFGTHVSQLHEEIMPQHPGIDSVIRGEPEWTCVAIAKALQDNGSLTEPIDGCTFRNGEEIIVGDVKKYTEHLDDLAYPAWHYFPLDHYTHPVFDKPYVMVNTSRGCVHACIFCVAHQFYGKKVRYRSVESVIDEIKNHVQGKHGVNHIWLYADDFTRDPEYVKELCQAMIDNNLNVTWWSNTRVDNRNEEMFHKMKESGCYMLSIGGESGSAKILKRIKKATKPEYISETVDILRRAKINSLVYFLIGLPGEDRGTIKETIDFAKKSNPDYVEFYPAIPYPGTEFHRIALEDGLIMNNDWSNYLCGSSRFVVNIPGVESGELDPMLRKAYRQFYFRPGYMPILFKRMANPVEFFRLVKFSLGYFKRFFK